MIPGVELAPEDWLLAPWRPRAVLPRPAERKFRRADSIRKLLSFRKDWMYGKAQITATISREEALFWLKGFLAVRNGGRLSLKQLEELAQTWDLSNPSHESPANEMIDQPEGQTTALVVLLERSYGWPRTLTFLENLPSPRSYHLGNPALDDVFRKALLPHLSEEDLDLLRELVRRRMKGPSNCPSLLLNLASLLDIPDAIRSWVRRPAHRMLPFGMLPEDLLANRPEYYCVFYADDALAWIAHTGLDHLDWIVHGLLQVSASAADPIVKMLTERLTGPEAAPHFLVLREKYRGAAHATAWLNDDLERTRRGLEGNTFRPYPKLRTAMLKAAGAMLQQAPPVAATVASPTKLPEPLKKELDDAQSLGWKPPEWLGSLPPIEVLDGVIDHLPVCAALTNVATDPLGAHPLARALREHADRASLDRFARTLLDTWRTAGAPAKDRWVLAGAALLGGPDTAGDLYELLQKVRSRMVILKLGYAALGRFYTPQVIWRAIQLRDRRFLEEVAVYESAKVHQIIDRALPNPPELTCDYGNRKFTLALDTNAHPIFIENNGQRHDKIPKPKKGESEAAHEAGQAAAKEVALIRKIIVQRIEESSSQSLRWTRKDFEEVVLTNQIYRRLAQLLVWGADSSQPRLQGTFRVTEDGSYADCTDQVFEFPEAAWHVCLVRPKQLTTFEAQAWRQLFADYELLPLLDQFKSAKAETPEEPCREIRLLAEGESSGEPLRTALAARGYTNLGEIWRKCLDPHNLNLDFRELPSTGGTVCASLYCNLSEHDETMAQAQSHAIREMFRDLHALHFSVTENKFVPQH